MRGGGVRHLAVEPGMTVVVRPRRPRVVTDASEAIAAARGRPRPSRRVVGSGYWVMITRLAGSVGEQRSGSSPRNGGVAVLEQRDPLLEHAAPAGARAAVVARASGSRSRIGAEQHVVGADRDEQRVRRRGAHQLLRVVDLRRLADALVRAAAESSHASCVVRQRCPRTASAARRCRRAGGRRATLEVAGACARPSRPGARTSPTCARRRSRASAPPEPGRRTRCGGSARCCQRERRAPDVRVALAARRSSRRPTRSAGPRPPRSW